MGRAYRWPVDAFGWCGPAPTVTLSLIGVNGDAPTRLRSRYSSLLDEGRPVALVVCATRRLDLEHGGRTVPWH